LTTVREAAFELFREHGMTTIFGNPGSTELLSALCNHRDDSWGGDPERRLRFPFECMRGIRAAVGHEPFVGYRINSTSFWPGDLETADIVDTRWPRILDVYLEGGPPGAARAA
jgi:hypothetical protein